MKTFEDVDKAIRDELLGSFSVYFNEQCLEQYVRGIYEIDSVTIDEIINENEEWVVDYLYERGVDK